MGFFLQVNLDTSRSIGVKVTQPHETRLLGVIMYMILSIFMKFNQSVRKTNVFSFII